MDDDLIRSARRSFLARHDATFDFDAGLADVRKRAAVLACDHIDGIVAQLGEALLVAGIRDLAGLHIQRAAGVLVQVRDHVAAGISLSGRGRRGLRRGQRRSRTRRPDHDHRTA